MKGDPRIEVRCTAAGWLIDLIDEHGARHTSSAIVSPLRMSEEFFRLCREELVRFEAERRGLK